MRVLKVAKRVHLPLGDRLRDRAAVRASSVRHASQSGSRQQHARIEELVEQNRVTREVVGGPARCAHQLRKPRQHRRVLGQQREIGAAPADRFEQVEQAMEHRLRRRGVDAFGAAATREQPRDQLVDALLRQRGQREVPRARAEARELGDEACGIVVARARQRLARLCVAEIAAPDGARAAPGRSPSVCGSISRRESRQRGATEQPRRIARSRRRDGGERRVRRLATSAKPAAPASAARSSRIRRQALRLPIVAILEPVLDVAQEHIGGRAARATAPAGRRPRAAIAVERGQRAARAQRGLAPAAHDLQRLHDELDFANAAGPELDVRARSRGACTCSRIWRWMSRRPS